MVIRCRGRERWTTVGGEHSRSQVFVKVQRNKSGGKSAALQMKASFGVRRFFRRFCFCRECTGAGVLTDWKTKLFSASLYPLLRVFLK